MFCLTGTLLLMLPWLLLLKPIQNFVCHNNECWSPFYDALNMMNLFHVSYIFTFAKHLRKILKGKYDMADLCLFVIYRFGITAGLAFWRSIVMSEWRHNEKVIVFYVNLQEDVVFCPPPPGPLTYTAQFRGEVKRTKRRR